MFIQFNSWNGWNTSSSSYFTSNNSYQHCNKIDIIITVAQPFSSLHAFFISNTFISNTRLKFGENLANVKQHFQAENEIIVQNCQKMAILGLQHVGNKRGWIFKIFKQQFSLTWKKALLIKKACILIHRLVFFLTFWQSIRTK